MDLDRTKEIEQQLWKRRSVYRTVMALDMSGFSQLTRQFGVVHCLCMVRRMQLTAAPIIDNFGGRLVRFEPDNCFASFEAPPGAVGN